MASNRPGPQLWVAIAILLVFAGGISAHSLVAEVTKFPARYAVNALFGALVGTTELVSRYRDKPQGPDTAGSS
jgi:hypothetical protein